MESKKETIGFRPGEYSQWHRTLGSGCYAVDIDFVEFRPGRGIVGFFGVTGRLNDERHIINAKQMIWSRTKIEREILHELYVKTGVPAYLVIHTEDLSVFHVHKVSDSIEQFRRMNNEEYTKFIKEL